MSSNTKVPLVLAVVAAVAVLGIGAVIFRETRSKSPESPTIVETPPAQNPSPSPITNEMPASDSGVPETVVVIDVEAGSFYYKPNVITVKKGQPAKIVLSSKDMMHDFNIDELNVRLPIVKSGNTGEVEFVADKVGEYEYYCSVGQHRKNGQVGKFIVTE